MAKKGRTMVFHGAFASKKKAVRKERRTKGAFIRKVRVRGHTRYLVMTERHRKSAKKKRKQSSGWF